MVVRRKWDRCCLSFFSYSWLSTPGKRPCLSVEAMFLGSFKSPPSYLYCSKLVVVGLIFSPSDWLRQGHIWKFWSLRYEKKAAGCFLKFYLTLKRVHRPVIFFYAIIWHSMRKEPWEHHETKGRTRREAQLLGSLINQSTNCPAFGIPIIQNNISSSYFIQFVCFLLMEDKHHN